MRQQLLAKPSGLIAMIKQIDNRITLGQTKIVPLETFLDHSDQISRAKLFNLKELLMTMRYIYNANKDIYPPITLHDFYRDFKEWYEYRKQDRVPCHSLGKIIHKMGINLVRIKHDMRDQLLDAQTNMTSILSKYPERRVSIQNLIDVLKQLQPEYYNFIENLEQFKHIYCQDSEMFKDCCQSEDHKSFRNYSYSESYISDSIDSSSQYSLPTTIQERDDGPGDFRRDIHDYSDLNVLNERQIIHENNMTIPGNKVRFGQTISANQAAQANQIIESAVMK